MLGLLLDAGPLHAEPLYYCTTVTTILLLLLLLYDCYFYSCYYHYYLFIIYFAFHRLQLIILYCIVSFCVALQ